MACLRLLRTARFAFVLLILLAQPVGLSAEEPSDMTAPEIIAFTGRVVRVELEGGFYGLLAPDGRRYDPMNLPDRYRRDGLVVSVRVRPKPGVVSFRMWGEIVEVVEIQDVGPSGPKSPP